MWNEYVRAFVIGSSFLVFLPFFYTVSQFKQEKFNYNYSSYTFVAPLVLGLMNMFSLFLAKQFQLTKQIRFLAISILAPTVVLGYVSLCKIYNYTRGEWIRHILCLYLLYFVMFNIVVHFLDRYI
jgi:hypothetical protein